MGINVSTTMGFENKEFLRNAARDILQRSGADSEKASEIVQKAIFNNSNLNTQGLILSTSEQITLNNSLRETLKYLREHSKKETKKYKFGELWGIVSANNESSEKNPYRGELYDFEIDMTKKNIFAA